ncbi:MAG: glycine zipper family protein, partial [Acetobacteraceae bacterium]|nr:glycine zipper family protein [Acetobacteraceae bacterium]
MHPVSKLIPLVAVLGLGACTVPMPTGPSVMALPGQGRDFASFQQDDAYCRQFAAWQTGGANPQQAAAQSAVGSAAL